MEAYDLNEMYEGGEPKKKESSVERFKRNQERLNKFAELYKAGIVDPRSPQDAGGVMDLAIAAGDEAYEQKKAQSSANKLKGLYPTSQGAANVTQDVIGDTVVVPVGQGADVLQNNASVNNAYDTIREQAREAMNVELQKANDPRYGAVDDSNYTVNGDKQPLSYNDVAQMYGGDKEKIEKYYTDFNAYKSILSDKDNRGLMQEYASNLAKKSEDMNNAYKRVRQQEQNYNLGNRIIAQNAQSNNRLTFDPSKYKDVREWQDSVLAAGGMSPEQIEDYNNVKSRLAIGRAIIASGDEQSKINDEIKAKKYSYNKLNPYTGEYEYTSNETPASKYLEKLNRDLKYYTHISPIGEGTAKEFFSRGAEPFRSGSVLLSIPDLWRASVAKDIIQKAERGEKLSEDETAVLDTLIEITTQQQLRQNSSASAGNIGEMIGEQLPFMLSIALGGAIYEKGAQLVAKKMAQRYLQKMGMRLEGKALDEAVEQAMKAYAKGATSAEAQAVLRGVEGSTEVLGRESWGMLGRSIGREMLSGLPKATFITAMSPQTYADLIDRTGTQVVGKDDQGNYQFKESDDSVGRILWDNWKENYTEIGTPAMDKVMSKGLSDLGRRFFSQPNTRISKTLGLFFGRNPYMNRLGVGGLAQEGLEEYYGAVLDAVANAVEGKNPFDDSWQQFFSRQGQAELWLSIAPMSVLGGAANVYAYGRTVRDSKNATQDLINFAIAHGMDKDVANSTFNDMPNMSLTDVRALREGTANKLGLDEEQTKEFDEKLGKALVAQTTLYAMDNSDNYEARRATEIGMPAYTHFEQSGDENNPMYYVDVRDKTGEVLYAKAFTNEQEALNFQEQIDRSLVDKDSEQYQALVSQRDVIASNIDNLYSQVAHSDGSIIEADYQDKRGYVTESQDGVSIFKYLDRDENGDVVLKTIPVPSNDLTNKAYYDAQSSKWDFVDRATTESVRAFIESVTRAQEEVGIEESSQHTDESNSKIGDVVNIDGTEYTVTAKNDDGTFTLRDAEGNIVIDTLEDVRSPKQETVKLNNKEVQFEADTTDGSFHETSDTTIGEATAKASALNRMNDGQGVILSDGVYYTADIEQLPNDRAKVVLRPKNAPSTASEQQAQEGNTDELPRDKEGNIKINEITDPNLLLKAYMEICDNDINAVRSILSNDVKLQVDKVAKAFSAYDSADTIEQKQKAKKALSKEEGKQRLLESTLALLQGEQIQKDEFDENGIPFIKASDGSTVFGEIKQEMGLAPAPIKLSEGNSNYGLNHIERRHGEEIRKAGYKSVEEFVEDVAKNFNTIRVGNSHNTSSGVKPTFIVELKTSKNKTLFIELSNDGNYWNINSAGVFRSDYSKNKTLVWTSPAISHNSTTENKEVASSNVGNNGSTDSTSGNSSQTRVSDSKDTTKNNTNEENLKNISEKFANTPKVVGFTATRTLPNGEKVRGTYMLVEAGGVTPSHDVKRNFAQSKDFPTREDGSTLNDRDYEQDKNAQEQVMTRAGKYNGQAVNDMPIVDTNGIVLSGNDRTMSGELAAMNNTDTAYLESLRDNAQMFGFTEEQVDGMQHPRLVFVLEENMPYTTETFAKFNASEKKAQNNVEKAVKVGKTIKPKTLRIIADIINKYDTIAECWNDPQAVNAILNTLIADGQLQSNDIAQYTTSQGLLNDTGKEYIETVLLGSLLTEENVRNINEMPFIRQRVLSSLKQILDCNTLNSDYTLAKEINEAIGIVYTAHAKHGVKQGEPLNIVYNQLDMFSEKKLHSLTVKMIADVMNSNKVRQLKKVLSLYVEEATLASNGQSSLSFDSESTEGNVRSKEDILIDILNQLGYEYRREQGQQSEPRETNAEDNVSGVRNQGERHNGRTSGTDATRSKGDGNTRTAERKGITEDVVTEALKELGLEGQNVLVANNTSDLPPSQQEAKNAIFNGVPVRGWYDPKTDRVYLYAPNLRDKNEVKAVVLHELVSHKGLRALLGNRDFNRLCDKVWSTAMDNKQRKDFVGYVIKQGGNLTEKEYQDFLNTSVSNPDYFFKITRQAADEYIAHIAEQMTNIDELDKSLADEVREMWRKICELIRAALHIGKDVKIDNNALAVMIHASYQNLRNNTNTQSQENNNQGSLFSIKDVNEKFNEELQQQIDGTLPKDHTYQLGVAGNILQSAGVRSLPIEMRASKLAEKSNQSNHPFDISTIKNLPQAIQEPIMVFDSSSVPGRKVILTEIQSNGVNFVVALGTTFNGKKIQVNDIRSIYPKDNIQGIIDWVNAGNLLRYADKNKALNWINQQQSNSAEVVNPIKNLDIAAKIIKNFENPPIQTPKNTTINDILFSINVNHNSPYLLKKAIEESSATHNSWLYPQQPDAKIPQKNELSDKKAKNISQRDIRFSLAGTHVVDLGDNTLVGLHNIGSDKLRKAIKQGGLANPSVAVIDLATQNHEGYGDISLVLPSDMIESSTGDNSGTFLGYAWTSTYPYVSKQLTGEGEKKVDELARQYSDGYKEIEHGLWRSLEDYIKEDRDRLHYLFLKMTGRNPEIVMNKPYHPQESYDKLKDLIDNGIVNKIELTKEESDRIFDVIIDEKLDDKDISLAAKNFLMKEFKAKYLDEDGILFFSVWQSFIKSLMRDNRKRKNPTANYSDTESNAYSAVVDNGLIQEYNNWKSKLFTDDDYKEYLFNGFTPSGTRRYLPNTIENASRIMNKESQANAYNNTVYGATRAVLLQKVKTLDAIRKNKGLLKNQEEVEARVEEMSNMLYDIVNRLSNMQRISYNQFSNVDYANARLIEAIGEKNPIRYLNTEYGYDIDQDSDFAKDLAQFVKDVKKAPVRYFETKFRRPVYLNEFVSAVVPNTIAQDLKDSLSQSGLKLYEYDKDNEGSRREATIQASNEDGIRFSIAVTPKKNLDESLFEPKKNDTFAKNTNDETDSYLHQRISQEKLGNGDGVHQKSATDRYTESDKADGRNAQTLERIGNESHEEIRQWAKENGRWIPISNQVKLGTPYNSGDENNNYINKDGYVYKVNNLMHVGGDVNILLDHISIHNNIFPETEYEFVGFTGFESGYAYPVFRQKYVTLETFASGEDIEGYMKKLGYNPTGVEAEYSDGSIVIGDLRARNVLKDNKGVLYVIDDDIRRLGEDNPRFSIANDNQEIFVSNAAKAIENIKQEKATPQQWLAMIEKNGGLKAGEDKWLGLSQWLKGSEEKTLTKQQVLDFINENAIKIEEVEYAEKEEYPNGKYSYESARKDFINEIQDYLNDHEPSDLAEDYGEDVAEFIYPTINSRTGEEDWSHITIADENALREYLNEHYDIDQSGQTSIDFEPEKKPINSTRLEYTTQGLDNKREIALTVPTIEPWNENDDIHFGDAGEGRAIAWIRFGETTAPEDGGKKLAELREIQIDNDKWFKEHPAFSKYGVADKGEDVEALKKESEERKARQRQAFDAAQAVPNKEKILVIDEIQSKRHQEGREKGYRNPKAREVAQSAFNKMDDALHKLIKKYGDVISNVRSDEELKQLVSQQDYDNYISLRETYYKAREDEDKSNRAVPDAPFDKNWMELAMKRMLRLAAEEGFDKVAWTTGEQQAERYNLSDKVDEIKVAGGVDNIFTVIGIKDGGILVQKDVEGEKGLADLIGKDVARKAYSNLKEGKEDYLNEDGAVSFTGDDLSIGGEGMKGFYDKMIPSFMNKYGKQWGVKVGEVTMPKLEDGYQTMHSIDVTPEMKESVMQGQTMFSIGKDVRDGRRRYAERKMIENQIIGIKNGMTEEQTNLIEELCSLRHELHTNKEKIAYSDADLRIMSRLVDLNADIQESGLKPIDTIPTYKGDYIDIDTIDLLQEIEEWPESGTQEWQDKYDTEFSRIMGELEDLNSTIENYLGDIDKKYGTHYRPTGMTRFSIGESEDMTPKNTTLDDVLFSIKVNHNSPYLLKKANGSFVDPETGETLGFDHRFMGRGEGAQVHGWGSYFSVNDLRKYATTGFNMTDRDQREIKYDIEKTSENINKTISNIDKIISKYKWGIYDVSDMLEILLDERDTYRELVKDYETKSNGSRYQYEFNKKLYQENKDKLQKIEDAIEFVKKNRNKIHIVFYNGHNYSVEIPDDNGSNYINENGILSEDQIEMLKKQGDKERELGINGFIAYAEEKRETYPFKRFRSDLETKLTPREISEFLNRAGFTGVHYYGATDGYCYVIFDDNDAKITDHVRFSIDPAAEAENKSKESEKFFNDVMDALDVVESRERKGDDIRFSIHRNANRQLISDIRNRRARLTGSRNADQDILEALDKEIFRMNAGWRNYFRGVRERWIDQDTDLQRLQEAVVALGGTITDESDAWNDINHSHSRAQRQIEKYEEDYFKPLVDTVLEVANAVENKLSIDARYRDKYDNIKSVKADKLQLVEYYLQALDIIEAEQMGIVSRGAEGFKDVVGMTPQDYVKLFEDTVDDSALLDKLQADLKRSTDRILDLQVFYNLSTEDDLKEFRKRKHYIPQRGFAELDLAGNEVDTDMNGMRAKSTYNEALRKAEGRRSLAEKPIAYIMNIAQSTIFFGEKNKSKVAMLKMIWDNQSVNGVDIMKELGVTVHEKGRTIKNQDGTQQAEFDYRRGIPDNKNVEVVYYGTTYVMTFSNPKIARSLNRDFQSRFAETNIIRNTGGITRLMTNLMTSLNPAFAATNLVRDAGFLTIGNFIEGNTAKVNVKLATVQPTVAKYLTTGKIDTTTKYGKYLEEFLDEGGLTGFAFLMNPDEIQNKLKRLSNKSAITRGRKWDAFVESLRFLSELSEASVRFAQYAGMRDAGHSVFQSVTSAKNITTNFNRKGTTSRVLSPFFGFLNATLQGTDRFVALLNSKVGYGVAAAMVVGGFMASLLSPNDDDDEVYFSDYERMTNICIGNIKIPLAHGFRVFYGLGYQLYSAYENKDQRMYPWGQAMFESIMFAYGDLLPITPDPFKWEGSGISADPKMAFRGIMPTSLLPIYDVGLNVNFMGYRIHPESFDKNKPQFMQAKKGTPQMYIDLSKDLFRLGGGDPKRESIKNNKGHDIAFIFDINPTSLQYLVEGYLSGWYKIPAQTMSAVENKDIKLAPIANRFTKSYQPEKRLTSEAWNLNDIIEDYSVMYNSIEKAYKNAETPEERNKYYQQMMEWRERKRLSDYYKGLFNKVKNQNYKEEEIDQLMKDIKEAKKDLISKSK